MKAVILASGIGKRLKPLTDKVPKPLVEVNGVTLLERIIRSLTENGIKDIVITTGSLEEKIKDFIQNKYPEIKITFISVHTVFSFLYMSTPLILGNETFVINKSI